MHLLRSGLGTALLLGVGWGCAAGPQPVAPQPEAPAEAGPLASEMPLAEDSAADQAALEALQELEFASLAKNGAHVRGVFAAPDPAVLDEPGEPRGGAASAAAPSYDIDMSYAAHERVQYYVSYFLGPARERFAIWLGRLPRYEGMVRARFRAAGVPEDLAYLALIESGFSNTAVSRARAVGMWQFIHSTGRLYGLTVDAWVDERRDPFKATEAAARFLADLNAQFGSWYVAAAAYNGGAGRVSRSIKRLPGSPDSVTDGTFFDLSDRRYLRRETRDYVPKLIAAAMIAKEPLRYGFDDIPQLAPLVFDEISVPDATGLDVLARLSDTTAAALIELNPHFIRGVTPPGRRSVVRVPRGAGPEAARRLTELPPSERVSFVEHIVRRGETLSEIAQRYRVSVRLIQAANRYVRPTRLQIGQRLVIPISSAARARAGWAPTPRPVAGGVTTHVVRRGETLWQLSRTYGVSVAQLLRWNGMGDDDVLKAGRRLRVAP